MPDSRSTSPTCPVKGMLWLTRRIPLRKQFRENLKNKIMEQNTVDSTSNAIKSQNNMKQVEKVLYTGKTHTTGGREKGVARSSDGHLDIKLSTPGTAGTGTNPEQLFAAGWSVCFEGAMGL